MIYRIAEIFAGLEGEGHNPGTPTVRIRLQGCTQPCKLRAVCDTQGALSPTGGEERTLQEIVDRVLSFDQKTDYPFPWVSISGGEPLEQTVEPLIWALQAEDKRVRVETSGMPRRLEGPVDYIRVSPKEPSPKRTRQDWGLELSVVYTGMEKLVLWEKWGQFAMRTLQPLWRPDGTSNVAEVIQICLQRPIWQLSVQTHKWLNIR